MIETTYIIVRTQFEGFHKYPDAPEEVAFLKDLHRHIFHVEAKIQVFHDDRELEFILVKRFLNSLLEQNYDFKSCEMIASSLGHEIILKYGKRDVEIKVFEDAENGGVYKREYN